MAKRWITYGAGAAFCMRYSCWVESLSTTKTTTAAAAAAAALSLSLFSLLTRTYARQPVPALHLSLCEYSLSFSHSLSAWKTAALGIVVGGLSSSFGLCMGTDCCPCLVRIRCARARLVSKCYVYIYAYNSHDHAIASVCIVHSYT